MDNTDKPSHIYVLRMRDGSEVPQEIVEEFQKSVTENRNVILVGDVEVEVVPATPELYYVEFLLNPPTSEEYNGLDREDVATLRRALHAHLKLLEAKSLELDARKELEDMRSIYIGETSYLTINEQREKEGLSPATWGYGALPRGLDNWSGQ